MHDERIPFGLIALALVCAAGAIAVVCELPTVELGDTPAEPEAVAVGFLNLEADPWAEVSLDGRPLGRTPLLRMELPAGEHRLHLENPRSGRRTLVRVQIRAGEVTARSVQLP